VILGSFLIPFLDLPVFFSLVLYISYPIDNFSVKDNFFEIDRHKRIKIISNLSDSLSADSVIDIFNPIYVIGRDYYFSDAGRKRSYSLLSKTYGKNRKEIESNLVYVNFLGKKLKFNSKNNAANRLSLALKEIEGLVVRDKRLLKFVENPETYCYRKIEGEDFLSSHSYGIGIDFVYKGMRYWRWDKNTDNNFPFEIVEIMEKYGFIWGGKWEHFDTMHFEYRPEFLLLNKIINAGY